MDHEASKKKEMAMSQGLYAGFGGSCINDVNMGIGVGRQALDISNGPLQAWNQDGNKFDQSASGIEGNIGANVGYCGYKSPLHQERFDQMGYSDNQHEQNTLGPPIRGRDRAYGRYWHAGQIRLGKSAKFTPFNQQTTPRFPRRGLPRISRQQADNLE